MGIGCVMKEKQSAQGSLPFGHAYTPEQEFGFSMRALSDVMDAAGNLVIAGATGIDKSDLPKMFEINSNRHFRFKAAFQMGPLASMELRRRALEPLARCYGFALTTPKPPKTKEQRTDIAEAVIRSLGPLARNAYELALAGDE